MERQREFEIVQHTRMNLLEIFLVEMTSRGPHGHDDLEIGLILEGSLTLFIDQERHDLRTGDLYVINRNQVHSFLNTRGRNRILPFRSTRISTAASIPAWPSCIWRTISSAAALSIIICGRPCWRARKSTSPPRIFGN